MELKANLHFTTDQQKKIVLPASRRPAVFFYFEPVPRKRRPCSVTHLARAR